MGRWIGARAAAMIVGVVLLSSCGFAGSSSKPVTQSSTPPSVQIVAPSTTATSSAVSPTTSSSTIADPSDLPACAPSALSVSLVSSSAAAGSVIRTYAFTNRGASSCRLFGYPGLQMYGAQGQALQTLVARVTMAENIVPIAPGHEAWFVLQYPDATGYSGDSCPAAAELAVTPPGGYSSILVKGKAGAMEPYGGTVQNLACGSISVQPVTPPGTALSP